jgi:hypothetical protein
MDMNTSENSIVLLVEQEFQNEQNSSQEWVSSHHSVPQQTLQFLKHQDLLANGMGLVSEKYHITYSFIPTHTQIWKNLPDSAVKYCQQYIRPHTHTHEETGQSIYRHLI